MKNGPGCVHWTLPKSEFEASIRNSPSKPRHGVGLHARPRFEHRRDTTHAYPGAGRRKMEQTMRPRFYPRGNGLHLPYISNIRLAHGRSGNVLLEMTRPCGNAIS